MFKKIVTSLALTVGLFHTSIASELTQLNSQLICGDYSSINSTIKEYNEIPFVRMVSHRLVSTGDIFQNQIVIFVNPQTKTYTMVERFSSDIYCVVSIGEKLSPVDSK